MITLPDIEKRIEQVNVNQDPTLAAREYLASAEQVLEMWASSKGLEPTNDKKEDFRLLALHRQGAKGDGSFNACRETCRELAYRYNIVMMSDSAEERAQTAKTMTHLALHLYLFIAGKMQVAGLGDFCCASKPIRTDAQDLI